MNAKEVFEKVMQNDESIALATAVDNSPSVRVVSFIWDNDKLYFTSFQGSPKNAQIEANSKVSFITIASNSMNAVRVTEAECKLSNLTVQDKRDVFVAKFPQMGKAFDMAIDQMLLFEVTFKKAKVTLAFRNIEEIEL